MKKRNYLILGVFLASAGVMANAQQLSNGSFDGTWVDCKPDGENVVGTQPNGWKASNVYKMGMTKELVTKDIDRVESADNSKSSVVMNSLYVGVWSSFFKMGDTAPGYLTLGTPWAYGDVANAGKDGDTSDGGTYGSIAFSYKPDAISLYMKRTHPSEKPSEGSRYNTEERASVIVYSWKGSTTSKVTTGLSTSQVVSDMVDREKDVLGMITEGVTKSGDFELISKSENYIEGNIADWTQQVYPIEYLSESAPEKVNIILATSDYFDRAALGTGNQFWVDDVDFVYYSTLTSLTVGGTAIDLVDGTYEYNVDSDVLPTVDQVVCEYKGKFATSNVAIDADNAQVVITVTNQGGKDLDGETQHVYTLQYQKAAVQPEGDEYEGKLNVVMMDAPIVTDKDQKVYISKSEDGKSCTFALYGFEFSGANIGDIIIENVAITEKDGVLSYDGSKNGLQLGGGAIVADVKLTGTEQPDGTLEMDIPVTWTNSGMGDVVISVTFNGKKVGTSGVESVDASAASVYGVAGAVVVNGFAGNVEVYATDGRLVKVARVDGNAEIALGSGLYIVRAGAKAQKVMVK